MIHGLRKLFRAQTDRHRSEPGVNNQGRTGNRLPQLLQRNGNVAHVVQINRPPDAHLQVVLIHPEHIDRVAQRRRDARGEPFLFGGSVRTVTQATGALAEALEAGEVEVLVG